MQRLISQITIPCLLLVILSPLIFSCDQSRVFEENAEIPGSTWDSAYRVNFHVNIEDTINPKAFYINLRHSGEYPYSNLYLFIDTKFPNGKSGRDTLECILSDPSGKWLGEGIGDIWDYRILLKKNVRFPQKGAYVFTLSHAMRIKELPFIEDIGLRIENYSKQN